ncbi:fumarylacetoacetate hydrolase family protein [Agromyces bauzanensis]
MLPLAAKLGISGNDCAELLGPMGLLRPRLEVATRTVDAESLLSVSEVRLGQPVGRPTTVIAIRFNSEIASVSTVVELRPGDIILTGTPGAAFQLDPPSFLRDGDVIVRRFEGLGEMRNSVDAEDMGQ